MPPTDTPQEPTQATEPVTPVTEETTPVVPQDTPTEEVQPSQTPSESAPETTPEPATVTETEPEEEIDYPAYQGPEYQPIDFSQLQADENGLIDPSALAGTINQSIAAAEERATARASQVYQEQRAEERSWDKAYEKYPDLKTNKELRDLVHNSRIGEVTNLLSKTQDVKSVKLPTPSQIADKLFKHMGTAKSEGMKQATENVVVQNSAHVETAGRTSDDAAENRSKLYQNINNPNKEKAKQARTELLKSMLFGNK